MPNVKKGFKRKRIRIKKELYDKVEAISSALLIEKETIYIMAFYNAFDSLTQKKAHRLIKEKSIRREIEFPVPQEKYEKFKNILLNVYDDEKVYDILVSSFIAEELKSNKNIKNAKTDEELKTLLKKELEKKKKSFWNKEKNIYISHIENYVIERYIELEIINLTKLYEKFEFSKETRDVILSRPELKIPKELMDDIDNISKETGLLKTKLYNYIFKIGLLYYKNTALRVGYLKNDSMIYNYCVKNDLNTLKVAALLKYLEKSGYIKFEKNINWVDSIIWPEKNNK